MTGITDDENDIEADIMEENEDEDEDPDWSGEAINEDDDDDEEDDVDDLDDPDDPEWDDEPRGDKNTYWTFLFGKRLILCYNKLGCKERNIVCTNQNI